MTQAPERAARAPLAEVLSTLETSSSRRGIHVASVETPSAPPRFLAAPEHGAEAPTEIDWLLVVELRRQASEEISRETQQWRAREGRVMPPEDRRLMGRSVIRQVVRAHAEQLVADGRAMWPATLERSYATAVENAIFGFGRMQPLFEIPNAENIEIHGFDSVVVQYGDGRRVPHPAIADSDDELIEQVRFLAESASPSRPFDDAHPTLTVAVGEKFRLHAIGFGLVDRPSIVIRHHILTSVTLEQLAKTGMLSQQLAELLRAAVMARTSIVISGDQGAGKTTLLRALIDAIPANERFGTIETDYELLTHLQPHRRNMVAMQARVGLGETTSAGGRVGEVTVADLIPEALRQNLARLIVGEVRGAEAGAMFEAMQAGAGTMSTTHSHSASSTIDRLASRVAQGGVVTVEEAYRQIAHNIGLIIHVELEDNTWRGGLRRRFVSEVIELTGAIESGRPVAHTVFRAARDAQPGVFHPSQRLLDDVGRLRSVRQPS